MVALSRDFGATWDERALQKYGEDIWAYFTGRQPRSGIDISFGYTYIYGGLFEVLCLAAQHLVKADAYVVRHAVNAFFGWSGIVCAFIMTKRLFGQRAAWLAAALLVSMPRYIGESMNNPKDLPFAVLMLLGFYYIVTLSPRYPYLSWPHAVKLALAIALALNVRSMGLSLLGYTAIALFLLVLASREWSPARLGATAGRFAVVTVLALIVGTAFWPWAQEQPLIRPIQAFFLASTFSWGISSLFAGRDVAAAAIPWYYLPTWLVITLPPVVMAGVFMSLWRLKRSPDSRVPLAALWAFVLLPATMVIVRHLTLYDGIRHVFFIVPPLAIIAAAGWDRLLEESRTRLVAGLLVAVGIAEPLVFQVRNHPNQNVYFSPVIGGPRGAFLNFEMDYWGNCVLSAVKWSNEQAQLARMPLVVTGNAWEVVIVDTYRFRSLVFERSYRNSSHLDIRLLKGPRQAVLDTNARDDVVHRVVMADGTPICVVVPGPAYPQLKERLAQVAAWPNGSK